jgi:SAM-dependent methyltransferase
MKENSSLKLKRNSFGTKKLSFIDLFGVWLSKRALSKQLKGMSGLNALELGCGYAAKNLIAIDAECKKITGVDFNISAEVKKNPKFIALELPIDDALKRLSNDKFDLIMIISVLEHLTNPEETLFKCRNLLNENGILIINVPTWTGKSFLEFSAFRLGLSPKEEMEDHKMYYNKRDLWPLLIRSGFLPSKIKMHYHKFYLNLFSIAKK